MCQYIQKCDLYSFLLFCIFQMLYFAINRYYLNNLKGYTHINKQETMKHRSWKRGDGLLMGE